MLKTALVIVVLLLSIMVIMTIAIPSENYVSNKRKLPQGWYMPQESENGSAAAVNVAQIKEQKRAYVARLSCRAALRSQGMSYDQAKALC